MAAQAEWAGFVEPILSLVDRASSAIMAIYRTDFAVWQKDDSSPVSEADLRTETILLEGLASLCPQVPVVAEESVAAGRIPPVLGRHFFLVDPIDGTKEFVSRNGEFTVNVALVEDGLPVFGVISAPAIDALYWVGGDGKAFRQLDGAPTEVIACRRRPPDGVVAQVSRSHWDARSEAFLAGLPVVERRISGSSLKFCRLAEGEGDVYPRFGPTREWDTAAGQAILSAAGGCVLDEGGAPLMCGKPEFYNPPYVAWGSTEAAVAA